LLSSASLKTALPTVLQLGTYPWSDADYQVYLQRVGSIIQLEQVDALLDPHFAGEKLGIQGLLCNLNHKLSVAHLERLPQLKVISNYGSGLDHLPLVWLKEKGIVVCNTPHALANAVADLTLALLLAVQRELVPSQAALQAGEFTGWAPFYRITPGVDGGKTLGLVGCGAIGQAVAKRALAFDMSVLYTQRNRLPEALEQRLGLQFVTLERLLQQSDVVSLHCPFTPETKHLLSAERLAMMKPGASLINTARGILVDEAALVAALKSGHLSGAGLDVFEQEPAVHPGLWECPNVVLLPHVGSATQATRQAMAKKMLEQLYASLGLPV
jgi:glyoxylate reductase